MNPSPAATGLARRGRRLSDQETEERMLKAAVGMISGTGLTVSLDHISFEEVIRAADVSRSTVYRRWPHKDLFFSDLVKDLARNSVPTIMDSERALIGRIIAERTDWFETAESRTTLIAELFRQAALLDFQALSDSPGWRTYVALHATFMSLADENLRHQVRAALAESAREHIARIARSWEQLTSLLGYRLRPDLGTSFEDLATLLDAAMRGLVLMALPMPELARERREARPFPGTAPADWSLPALALTGIATGLLEPDPGIVWDKERIARVTQALEALVSAAS
jgi:AcrR family transcriptional regulator